jgi:FMN phosphatase YigB (HAD superfamily)
VPIRAVLFDYGLTLVDFEFPTDCLLAALETGRHWLGADVPDARWLLFNVLHPLEDELERFGEDEVDYMTVYSAAWRRAGIEAPPDVLYRILDLEQRCWDAAVRLAPGALETLDALRARGLRTGIASNAPFPPEMMHRQVNGNGIGSRVDAVLFSAEVGKRKPARELYQAGLAALDTTAGETLYVGDRVREDFEGPRSLGMRAVICTALARAAPPPAVPTVARLEEVLDLL